MEQEVYPQALGGWVGANSAGSVQRLTLAERLRALGDPVLERVLDRAGLR